MPSSLMRLPPSLSMPSFCHQVVAVTVAYAHHDPAGRVVGVMM